MKRHDFDLISAIFAATFIGVGLGFLMGNVSWFAVEPIALVAMLVVAAGILIGVTALRQITRE